ncbi:MAG: hypothetical protein RLZZ299_1902 [Pseudomonadota bacterium]
MNPAGWVAALPPLATTPERVVVGVLAGVLLLAGARVYRVAVVLPGVLIGLLGGSVLAPLLPLPPGTGWMVVAGAAAFGGVAAWAVERAVVVAAGAMVGLVGGVLAMPLLVAFTPWWAPLAGAVVGALLGPWMFRKALVVVTSALGALALCWAAGWVPEPWNAGVAWAVGVLVQSAAGRRGDARHEEAAED